MAKRVIRKHTTLFVGCQKCNRLLEISPNDILNEGSDDWTWDIYALKGKCPNCGYFEPKNFYIGQRHFYAYLVAKAGPILKDD